MGLFDSIKGLASKAWGGIKSAGSSALSSAMSKAKEIGGNAFSAGKEAFGSGNIFSGGIGGLMKRGRSALSAGWDSAKGGINEATGGHFSGGLDELEKFGTSTLDKAQEKVGEFGNSKYGGMLDSVMKMVA
ncbi:hypothetical protein FACS1894198_4310 [Clostridia bacterium]|nr:hypothetical protein FACS1894198_4310 [Clostridia bacterium]